MIVSVAATSFPRFLQLSHSVAFMVSTLVLVWGDLPAAAASGPSEHNPAVHVPTLPPAPFVTGRIPTNQRGLPRARALIIRAQIMHARLNLPARRAIRP